MYLMYLSGARAKHIQYESHVYLFLFIVIFILFIEQYIKKINM